MQGCYWPEKQQTTEGRNKVFVVLVARRSAAEGLQARQKLLRKQTKTCARGEVLRTNVCTVSCRKSPPNFGGHFWGEGACRRPSIRSECPFIDKRTLSLRRAHCLPRNAASRLILCLNEFTRHPKRSLRNRNAWSLLA